MLSRFFSAVTAVIIHLQAFYSQDLIRNFPYCLPFNHYSVILGNFVLDPALNNRLIDTLVTLNTRVLDIVLML